MKTSLTEQEFDSWLKALRSGEYKQTTHVEYNRTDCSFCAMGVLGTLIYGIDAAIAPNYNTHLGVWADLRRIEIEVDEEDLYRTVARWNDRGMSFEEIANRLEKHRSEILRY